MKLTLHVWRQDGPHDDGEMRSYQVSDINPAMSFLEMLDVLNEQLAEKGEREIAFDSDCREGICGTCSLVINGTPHGPQRAVTTCQIHMREFEDGDELWIEPFRAEAFPMVRDLVCDRGSFDRIMQKGGFVSVNTGSAPDANAIPIGRELADNAMNAAACIGCGACVASCPNAAAMLFTGAKVTHLGLLPQGQPERFIRVDKMVNQMDSEDFGHCTNFGECTLACPKSISLDVISQMNGDYFKAQFKSRES